ncbi:MAG TPA: NAD-dependent epimerase/dehydratase family protein [Bacilli bacterium]|nr:NAD-dependent epimerase/dehydratase family protein [Bacilli bacterium]
MKVLITGANGFIGKNLSFYLKERNIDVLGFDLDNSTDDLKRYLKAADFVVHLAGANRPKSNDEFYEVNRGLTETIIDIISEENLKLPLIFSSTIHAEQDNDYGKSKKAAEEVLFAYEKATGNKVYVFRLHNLFGKWSRPHYNSVIATFCHNVAHNEDITINDPNAALDFVYIDDVVKTFYDVIIGAYNVNTKYYAVKQTHNITIGELARLIKSFKESRENRLLPDVQDAFVKKLYSTYLTYLPVEAFKYPLLVHQDERGLFSEFIKGEKFGQVSVNVITPGFTKGNHYHHTKIEKFLVLTGEATINFKHIATGELISLKVSGEKLEVVDIPPGYTHNIVNETDQDVVFVIWANEMYDPDNADTIFKKVE